MGERSGADRGTGYPGTPGPPIGRVDVFWPPTLDIYIFRDATFSFAYIYILFPRPRRQCLIVIVLILARAGFDGDEIEHDTDDNMWLVAITVVSSAIIVSITIVCYFLGENLPPKMVTNPDSRLDFDIILLPRTTPFNSMPHSGDKKSRQLDAEKSKCLKQATKH